MKDMLAASIERILTDLSPSSVVRSAEAGTWPAALWQQIEEAGIPLALAPEALGGVGLGWSDIVPVLKACGRHAGPVPLPEAIAAHALAGLAGRALPPGIATLALFEQHTDGRITARDVPFGTVADLVVGTLPRASGQELIVLERPSARQTAAAAPLAGDSRCDLEWSNPASLERAPLPTAASVLELGAALRTAQLAGAVARVIDMSIAYANDRKQFGQPISKFQAIQHQLSVLGELGSATAMAAELACASANADLSFRQVACGKARASEAANQAAAIATAVHGAIGITAEHDLQFLTRRLWAWRLDFGSDVYWNAKLGEQLLGAKNTLWQEVVEITSVV